MSSTPEKPASSRRPQDLGFSFQEDLWFGDFDDDAAREAAASSMAAMAGRVMGARPFPAAAQKLVQLTRDENANIHKVVRVLESDPGLSQRVLRLVNSAGYGLRVRCTSLNHATALLGQQRLQQIATSAVLLNHFGKTSDETKRKQEHGALVASLCRYLAIHLGLPQEDLFTCGLLHDLGQLMMLDDGDKDYCAMVNAHEDQWDALHISEREILGFDHAVLAAHVLASWSIPAPVPEVIALHHQPALAHQRGPTISAMVQTLRFADHMAHLLGHYDEQEGAKMLSESEAASYLGFSEMQIAAMWKDLEQLHDANRHRRMDIADVAPRSVNVPPSLSPRAIPITDAPGGFSEAPPSGPMSQPPVSQSPGAMMSSLPPEEPAPSIRFVGGTSVAPEASEQEILKLSRATPMAEHATHQHAAEEFSEEEAPSVAGAEPEVFPCALCYGPTFGAKCPVCEAHVCSAHQTSERDWCMACDSEFHRYVRENAIGRVVRIAASSAIGVAVLSSGLLGGWDTGFGVLGICLTLALGAYGAYQGYLKAQFKKERAPNQEERETTPPNEFAGLPPEAAVRASKQMEMPDEVSSAPAPMSAPVPVISPAPSSPATMATTPQSPSAMAELEGGDTKPYDPPIVSQRPPADEEAKAPSAPIPSVSNPLISMAPQSGNTIQIGSMPPPDDAEADAQRRQALVTVPAPSVKRAREREAASQAPDGQSVPPSANDVSWPPSQDAPPQSQRTSFLPQADGEAAPKISFSQPPPASNENDAPLESMAPAPEPSHPAIAPPPQDSEPPSADASEPPSQESEPPAAEASEPPPEQSEPPVATASDAPEEDEGENSEPPAESFAPSIAAGSSDEPRLSESSAPLSEEMTNSEPPPANETMAAAANHDSLAPSEAPDAPEASEAAGTETRDEENEPDSLHADANVEEEARDSHPAEADEEEEDHDSFRAEADNDAPLSLDRVDSEMPPQLEAEAPVESPSSTMSSAPPVASESPASPAEAAQAMQSTPPINSAPLSGDAQPAPEGPQFLSQPPACEPVALTAKITPPVIGRTHDFCTAPQGTVKITAPLTSIIPPHSAPPPSNDQQGLRASGEG